MSTTAFHDLTAYLALPRLAGLAMAPDGTRLVVGVATLEPKKKQRYVTALWEIDPRGAEPARRLTRGADGEANAALTPTGDLLFTASRGETSSADESDEAPLWLLPHTSGEARVIATRPGGFGALAVARQSGTLLAATPTLPSSGTAEDDAARRRQRNDAGVTGILHESYPVRFWDHDLGPARTRLAVAESADPATARAGTDEPQLDLRDLTGDVSGALDDQARPDLSADGSTAVTRWLVAESRGSVRETIVAVDTRSGARRTLLDDDRYDYNSPRISPDGSTVAAVRVRRPDPETPPDVEIVLVGLAGGGERNLTAGWDNWPKEIQWTPDGAAIVISADLHGRGPVHRLDLATNSVTALTSDDYAYTDLNVSPDGDWVYALRSCVTEPPHPVRIALTGSGSAARSAVQPLPAPAPLPELPAARTEITATAGDGSVIRAWLMLPPEASADNSAPLLLWIHGGPLSSWNSWSWRWNPALMCARGYAVLLPDPALSTGYGLDFIRRGWGAWGAAPYTDLMAVTDAALRRDDLDADRTAAMGGSFGGYMANWVAGNTDRFRAIVTHASLWALDQFGKTTDVAYHWRRELTPQMEATYSPHLYADKISTPMLVIHGDKDYRVPIGEGLRLWWDLLSRGADPEGRTGHRFLYFPDENHWVLAPGNARLWYETVLAFLDRHVLDKDWVRPELLG